jgi:hypothetical protein
VDADILEAVAAEAPATTELLAELTAAPALLGAEVGGQALVRWAFAVKRLRSASGRSRRTSTASTSACTCPR